MTRNLEYLSKALTLVVTGGVHGSSRFEGHSVPEISPSFCHLILTLFLASHHLLTTSSASALPFPQTNYFTPIDVYLPGIRQLAWSNVSVELVMVNNISTPHSSSLERIYQTMHRWPENVLIARWLANFRNSRSSILTISYFVGGIRNCCPNPFFIIVICAVFSDNSSHTPHPASLIPLFLYSIPSHITQPLPHKKTLLALPRNCSCERTSVQRWIIRRSGFRYVV